MLRGYLSAATIHCNRKRMVFFDAYIFLFREDMMSEIYVNTLQIMRRINRHSVICTSIVKYYFQFRR